MKISVDKSLPVSLQAQIVGAIEYGVMAGTFHHDAALPSVRALSKQLGVAQLTVSHAYSTLKEMGLIETIPGKGTYVMRERLALQFDRQVADLRLRFQSLLADADGLGLSPSFFIGMLNGELAGRLNLPYSVAFVGNSNRINQRYLTTIQETLNLTFRADSYTFHEFDELPESTLKNYQLCITIPHCIPRLKQRLPPSVPVYAPYLIPSEETRTQLASLATDSPVLLVSRFENFIPAMREGVKSYAPHLGDIRVITLNDDRLPQTLAAHEVVIYSTGCHSFLQQFPARNVMFEYRHTPEPRYLRDILSPALHQYAQTNAQ